MKQKNKIRGFLAMLLGTLGASFLGNLLTVKGIIRASEDTIRAGERLLQQLRIFNAASSFSKF